MKKERARGKEGEPGAGRTFGLDRCTAVRVHYVGLWYLRDDARSCVGERPIPSKDFDESVREEKWRESEGERLGRGRRPPHTVGSRLIPSWRSRLAPPDHTWGHEAAVDPPSAWKFISRRRRTSAWLSFCHFIEANFENGRHLGRNLRHRHRRAVRGNLDPRPGAVGRPGDRGGRKG